MKHENLISFDDMTPERHRELSARGGKASGEKRRKNAELRNTVATMLAAQAIQADLADEFNEFLRQKRRKI